MNSHDIHRHAEPLSPEERALGERLARLGPQGEPSAALDARILAAAHAAASRPSTEYRAPRRWPMALGIAASLTLAVGIAWQLRPAQEATVYDEAASAAASQAEAPPMAQESSADLAAADAAADQANTVAVEPPPSADASPAQMPGAGSRREPSPPASVPRSAAQRARAPAPAPPSPSEPEVVFDDAVPTVDAPSAAPAAPPAAPMRPPSAAPAAKAIADETRTQAAGRDSAETSASNVAGTAASAATQAREDAFAEDVPPATADSPEVREAWLQRIRELAKTGDTEDARASLQEFVRRYPNHPLPDDLRALLE